MGHADDLRSTTSAKDALHAQAETFVNGNFLKHVSTSQPDVSNTPFSLSASTATKCLELSRKISIEKNIANAHRAFFGFSALKSTF